MGRCNRGRGARYWAVCVLLADSSWVMFRIWTSFGCFVWSGGARTLNCRFCPHDGDISRRPKWGRNKRGHQITQFLVHFWRSEVSVWRTLLADGDPLETLSVDGQPAARVRRRCHPLCATSSGWCAPNVILRGERNTSVTSTRESGAQMHNATQSIAGSTASGRLRCNRSFFRMLQRNRSILHQKLHLFVFPFVPSPFGPPQTSWVRRPRKPGRRMSGTSRRFPRHFLNCNFP